MKRSEFNALQPNCIDCVYHKPHQLELPSGPIHHLCRHPLLMYVTKLSPIKWHSVDCMVMREPTAYPRYRCGPEGKFFNL